MRLRFVLGKLEQVERAFDVDLMRRDGRELRARGEERRQVKHQLDAELGENALEHAGGRESTR